MLLVVHKTTIEDQSFLELKKLIAIRDAKDKELLRSEDNDIFISLSDYYQSRIRLRSTDSIIKIGINKMFSADALFSPGFLKMVFPGDKNLLFSLDLDNTYIITKTHTVFTDFSSEKTRTYPFVYEVLGIRTIYKEYESTENTDECCKPFYNEDLDVDYCSLTKYLIQKEKYQFNKANGLSSFNVNEAPLREKIKTFVEQPGAYKRFHEAVAKIVIGQPELKNVTYNVFIWLKNIAYNKQAKFNTLLAAPSGSGKTETFRAIKKVFQDLNIDIPVIIMDISRLTPEGVRGMSLTSLFMPMFQAKTNGIGLVLMDEFDKRLYQSGEPLLDAENHMIQSQLLTLFEGIIYTTESERGIPEDMKGAMIDTSNTLFVCAGAFATLRKERMEKEQTSVGFLTETTQENTNQYKEINVQEIMDSGALPELIGRFSTVINYRKLPKEDVITVINRYKEEFELITNTTIEIAEPVIDELYDIYFTSELGCRTLRSKLWNTINDQAIQNELENNNNHILIQELNS